MLRFVHLIEKSHNWKYILMYLQVGDGTTSVVLIAGEILKQLKPFVDEEVHSRVIIRALRKATQLSVDYIEKLAVRVCN
jgi:T-complex protein 1 subunit eta